MKNFRIALAALLMMGFTTGVVNAQDKATDKKTTTTKTQTSKSSSGQHLKKDGTPDMRYKENKQTGAAKGSDTKTAPAKGKGGTPGGSGSGKKPGGSGAPAKGSSSGKSSGGSSSKPAKSAK